MSDSAVDQGLRSFHWTDSRTSTRAILCRGLHRPFVRGPIPLKWMRATYPLGGKATCLALEIWFLVGVTRNTTVQLNLSSMKKHEMSRSAASRALGRLRRAGLIEVQFRPGARSTVTVIV